MNNNIIYRNLEKKDYKEVKRLINEGFGFDDFIKDEDVLDSLLEIYMQECIIDSSFGRVAEKEGVVIGIILGKANSDSKKLSRYHNRLSMIKSLLKLCISNKNNKKLMSGFTSIQHAYNEMIKGRECDFDGCAQLFIVSKESRGFGVGKELMNQLYTYMHEMNVKSFYLYTDTRCNFGFYDSQNFKRVSEKEIELESLNESMTVFLYGYYFK